MIDWMRRLDSSRKESRKQLVLDSILHPSFFFPFKNLKKIIQHKSIKTGLTKGIEFNNLLNIVKGGTALKYSKVPEATIRRLSTYSRCLEEMENIGEKVVSSAQLANRCLVNAAQVRKDLAYFGEFGIRGVGYYVKDLLHDIKRILGLNKEWKMAVIGVGNLGSALLSYKDFLKQNYKIVAAFDIDPPKVIGRVSEKLGKPVEVLHISRIKEVAKERKIEIGLITTPASEAQNIANLLVEAEVKGILNFAPAQITVPDGYVVKDVFFTTILDNLAYLLSN